MIYQFAALSATACEGGQAIFTHLWRDSANSPNISVAILLVFSDS